MWIKLNPPDGEEKKFEYGYSSTDNHLTVQNWQKSTKLTVFTYGKYFCFARNLFTGRVYRKAVLFNCEEGVECQIAIRRIKIKPNVNEDCTVKIKRIKVKATQVASKKIIGVIGIQPNNNALISNMTEQQVCESFGTNTQVFEDWYIKADENVQNGTIIYVDNNRTTKITANKVYGITYNNKNYTFTSSSVSVVTNLVECSSVEVPTSDVVGFYYTSFNDYDGNNPTLKRFLDLRELYNGMCTGMFYGESICETIKTSGASGAMNVGDKLFDGSNVQITGNCFVGYLQNDSPKFIRISEGLIAEKGDLVAQTSVTGTTVLFPYSTKIGSGDSGYGFLSHDGGWWKARLRLKPDQQTIDFVYNDGATGAEFTTNDGTYNYQVKPWFSIGRAEKIFGIPNNYKIPDMFRGTWIELLGSCDVTTTRGVGESDNSYYTRIGNVETNYNYGFHILVGR